MKKTNSILALACAVLFALGTAAIAAEKSSQDMNKQSNSSQMEMQKGQKQQMSKANAEKQAQAVPVRASHIIGMKVTNDKDENLGKINNLLINKDGSVAFAVISYGGFAGIERHLIPIPWRELRPGPKAKEFSVSFTKAQFEKTPRLRFSQLADVKKPGWEHQLNQYYADLRSGKMSKDWGKAAAHGKQQKQESSMTRSKTGSSETQGSAPMRHETMPKKQGQ